jgi:hypothetical protein
MPAELTLEDQLVTDLVDFWTAYPPAAFNGVPVIHFRRTEDRPLPCIIIGHEGFEREKAKGMEGTGRVNFRIAVMSDLDVTPPEDHRDLARAADDAVTGFDLTPGPLALTYLHAFLRESPAATIEDRREITVLRWQCVATRMAPAAI